MQEYFAGLDVAPQENVLCVVVKSSAVVLEAKIPSGRAAIAEALHPFGA